MSLYNALFGVNPHAGLLLRFLGVSYADVPRFRDCYLNEDATEIIILTRTGGGNREDYAMANSFLRSIEGFIQDDDLPTDSTYNQFRYKVNESLEEFCTALKYHGGTGNAEAKWKDLFAALEKKDTSDPAVQRAMAVGKQIMEAIQEKLGDKNV
jgi:hypothetical protein